MKKIILCDIDGTIANNGHRQHFLEGKKDWDGFFSELINDEPIFPIINKVIEEYKAGKDIIFLTGRPERYRYSTTTWLKEYFSFDIKLLMRKDGDLHNKVIVKKQIFETNFNASEIDYILDNDPDLLAMWNNYGIKTFEVKDY